MDIYITPPTPPGTQVSVPRPELRSGGAAKTGRPPQSPTRPYEIEDEIRPGQRDILQLVQTISQYGLVMKHYAVRLR